MKHLLCRLTAVWRVLTTADYVVIVRKRKANKADMYRNMSEYLSVLYMKSMADIIVGGAKAADEAHRILNENNKDI